jgi:predicted ATPase/DNA-binding SARP family transcriptional activator
VEFGVLGPLEVRAVAGAVPIRRGFPRTLLIALLLKPGQVVVSDTLIDLLWRDELPRNPANALQIQVSYLRKRLAAAEPDGASLLATRGSGYALQVEPDRIDARRFETAVRQFPTVDTLSSPASLASAIDEVDAALGLWRGEALEDVAGMDFARGEATRLDELRWAATERRMELLLRAGRHVATISDLAELVQRMPLRERFHELLVLALYRSGRQGDALRAYEQARHTLADELGIDPGTALRELQRAVLRQAPELDWTPPESAATAAPAASARGEPPASLGSTTGRVPVPVSPLIGRDAELARLDQLLETHRALTLTGPAGAGKTRLAIDLSARRPGPVWYVDLSPIAQPSRAAPAVAAAAGVSVAPGDDPVEAIASTLAGRQGLLVLDTCEHLVPTVARLASAVLRAGPGVRVLATSRRTLGMSGEFAWPVPPLALPDPDATSVDEIMSSAAVALFVERAAAVRPDLHVDRATARDIGAVCLALDGLPLAIELAAARSDVLSPAAIRARLGDRFGLLVDGGADVAERQQTLRRAIDWSFTLLSPDQRTFFARLGTFAGTFDLEAALSVAGAGLDSPLDLLVSLVKQSMVSRTGQDRYHLLDTLRAYALEVLDDLDPDATRDQHAAFYAELAVRGEVGIRGSEQLAWLESLRSDVNNFRTALDWSLRTGDLTCAARQAAALSWFWTLNGMLTEAIRPLARLLPAEDIPTATRAKCHWGYALLAASLGELTTARTAGYRAVELGREAGDDAEVAYGLNAVAVSEWALGDHSRSESAHCEAIALFEQIGDAWGLAVCKVLLARTLFDRGDTAAAQVAKEGVEAARRAGDRHVLGIALTQTALMAMAEGDHEAALRTANEALALQEAIGYTEGTVSALHVLGQSHRLAGDAVAARDVHLQALRLATRIGHAAATCEAVEDLARVDADEDPAVAHVLLHAARQERDARRLPLRRRDAEELDRLEALLAARQLDPVAVRPFSDLVAELIE